MVMVAVTVTVMAMRGVMSRQVNMRLPVVAGVLMCPRMRVRRRRYLSSDVAENRKCGAGTIKHWSMPGAACRCSAKRLSYVIGTFTTIALASIATKAIAQFYPASGAGGMPLSQQSLRQPHSTVRPIHLPRINAGGTRGHASLSGRRVEPCRVE